MLYRKLEVNFAENEERFNRTLMVRDDLNLEELGVVLGTALGAEFEHMFMFKDRDNAYVHDAWSGMDAKMMSAAKLDDIDEDFLFIYDTGEDWTFRCHLGDKEKIDSDEYAILLDGNGQGIWEDNKSTLVRYLDGELDPNTSKENEEEGVYFPWNLVIRKLSDFDTDYDLQVEAENLNDIIALNMEDYMRNKEEMMNPFSFFGDDDLGWASDFDDGESVSLQEAMISMVFQMIDQDEYVRDAYESLNERFGQEDALYYLSLCLSDEISDMVNANEFSSRESFRDKIESLNQETGIA